MMRGYKILMKERYELDAPEHQLRVSAWRRARPNKRMDGPLLDTRGATVAAIRKAFERAGIAFTDDNGLSLKNKPARGR